jgi:hypothetical protein
MDADRHLLAQHAIDLESLNHSFPTWEILRNTNKGCLSSPGRQRKKLGKNEKGEGKKGDRSSCANFPKGTPMALK